MLTSLTTFAGLTPLLMETSVQSKLVIPMAVSLAFGVLFATLISLLIVPAHYLILEDLKALLSRARRRNAPPRAADAQAESPEFERPAPLPSTGP
jgi:predicted RND superfamily exporter protein